jgi:catechol 2,3-dioxygenase-like lactoylglutathione lyase family enzyme
LVNPWLWPDEEDMMHLDLVTIVVPDYDEAVEFFRDVLGFEVAENAPSTTNDGRPK